MKIPFHKPIFPSDLNAILGESTESGWVTTGPKVKEFEKKLSLYFQANHIIALNSCTAALHLALAAKGIGKGDKFIAPTYTFVASVEVGEYLGAKPVLVDSDYETFNINLNQVKEILHQDKTKKIKAIIPVHYAGQAVDMKQVNKLADQYDLFVLEDSAHAVEAVSNLGKVGNTNHAAAFSFYANKNISSGGEGGALATNDTQLAEKVRKLSLHGMSKDGWNRYKTGGKWAYDVSDLGYKYNMTDIAASFGIEQLIHIDDWHRRRIEIVKQYNNEMSDIKGLILPHHTNGDIHSWHLYVVRVLPNMWNINRNKLIEIINEEGIGTSVHYTPVHMHSYYEIKYGYRPDDFPVSKELSETVITLPLYPKMTDEQVRFVISTIMKLWKQHKR